jgi:hypothetical protein
MQKIAPEDRAQNGPFDVSEIGLLTPYVDFGAIRIAPTANVLIRADIDDNSKRVVAITLEQDGHRIQLQAFAASKVEGIWASTLDAIESAIANQGGTCERITGLLGPETKASVPVTEGDKRVMRESRFVGVDGPRWFLRGVMTGPELYSQTRYTALIELFRSVVVNRGEVPMPPGDLLPLTIPVQQ